ncbi:hypothetical protein KNP414_01689 [Paenibacillus mucilaginosus KNP414]|uniref:Uncharacterized protein n=1 Tax=Paenibacillus mucilaginosus (strain KNP414) TaxID=1036673 RepID=F8FPM7_PAEMK|nr:hypothetical protein KNP414_01689 [Paenibacillus mucilaginosus KNP414]
MSVNFFINNLYPFVFCHLDNIYHIFLKVHYILHFFDY